MAMQPMRSSRIVDSVTTFTPADAPSAFIQAGVRPAQAPPLPLCETIMTPNGNCITAGARNGVAAPAGNAYGHARATLPHEGRAA